MSDAPTTSSPVSGEHLLEEAPLGLRTLMRKWCEQAEDAVWADKKDCSWWYGERASVSQLAGAAWSIEDAGGWAMQERPSTKGSAERGSRQALIDLWIRLQGFHFVAEAKQVWPLLDHGIDEAQVLITTALRDIAIQFRRLATLPGHAHVSLVFVAPRLSDPAGFDEGIGHLVGAIKEHNLFAAWTFPNWARNLRSQATEYYYPGVALLARVEPDDAPSPT